MGSRRKAILFRLAGVLFIVLFALLYSHDEVGMSGNESGRFATVQAVAEQGVFHIEKCNFRTVDKTARNGHLYYDKLPALPFALGMIYRPLHRYAGLNFVDNYHLSIYLINLLLGSTVNILLFLWLFDLLRGVRRGRVEVKFLLALGGVFGSWLLTYSTMLNNHTPAALAVLGVFIALRKFQKQPTVTAAALAGVGAGCAGLLELPCGFFFGLAAVAGVFFAARSSFGTAGAARFAAVTFGGGALFVLLGAALNCYAYGTALPLYVGSGGARGTFGIGVQRDAVEYWWTALAGDRGLFSYTPFLLLALPGIYTLCRQAKHRRGEAAWCAGAGLFALFYLTCTNEFGGQSYGFRYFIPLIPVLWFFAGAWLLGGAPGRWKAPLAAVLILYGAVTGLTGAYFPFNPGNEGANTPPGHFTENFSSFGGNLLCWSYENAPDSKLTRLLIRRYGYRPAGLYLYWSFFHQKKLAQLARLRKDFPEFFKNVKNR